MFLRKNKNKGNICVVHHHIGYKKDTNKKNHLVVDENVRDIIVKIFDMYINGSGSKIIVKYLNDNHYLSPLGYRLLNVVSDENNTKYLWNPTGICNILKNEIYIGNSIQHRVTRISYKVKKIRKVDKEEQIRVNNTHEAIIDKETFEKVQVIQAKEAKKSTRKYEYLLSGLLYCQHCNRKLQIVLKKNNRPNSVAHPYIVDASSKIRGCYARNLNYYKFEERIKEVIKRVCSIYVDKNLLKDTYNKCKNNAIDMSEVFQKQINSIDEQLYEINKKIDQLYDDRLNGILPEDDFKRISQKYLKQRAELGDKKRISNEQIRKFEQQNMINNEEDTEKLDKIIDDFLKMETIDKTVLYRLIDKIEIDKDKNVFINFNFSQLNIINDNIDEFVEIEKIIGNDNNELDENVG